MKYLKVISICSLTLHLKLTTEIRLEIRLEILLSNDEYTNKLKNPISESLSILDQNGISDDEITREFIKFKIRQFSITLSKNLSKSLNPEREILEKELLKDFEKSSSSYYDKEDYLACKTKPDKIYD